MENRLYGSHIFSRSIQYIIYIMCKYKQCSANTLNSKESVFKCLHVLDIGLCSLPCMCARVCSVHVALHATRDVRVFFKFE